MRGHVNEVVGKVDVVLSRGLENECASVPKTWVGLADQRDDGELKHDMCKGKPAPPEGKAPTRISGPERCLGSALQG